MPCATLPPRSLRLTWRATAAAFALAVAVAAAALAPTTAIRSGRIAPETSSRRPMRSGTRRGSPRSCSDPALDAAAAEWARHLASSCTFAHSSSTWRSSRVSASGWIATGENIAAGQPDATAVVTSWMNSPGHKANILDKRYTGLGVGYVDRHLLSHLLGAGLRHRHTAQGPPRGARGPHQRSCRRHPGTVRERRPPRLPRHRIWCIPSRRHRVAGMGEPTFRHTRRLHWRRRPRHRPCGGGRQADAVLRQRTRGLRDTHQIGTGWSKFSQLIGGIDFDGDGFTDIIARTAGGELHIYRGNGRGGWLASGGGAKIGSGWQIMTAVSYVGDMNGDARGDLVARRSNGTLWLYPSTGKGGWAAPVQIGQAVELPDGDLRGGRLRRERHSGRDRPRCEREARPIRRHGARRIPPRQGRRSGLERDGADRLSRRRTLPASFVIGDASASSELSRPSEIES